eukprot:Selendium_serpulae@DN6074_c0_g2_i2.p1
MTDTAGFETQSGTAPSSETTGFSPAVGTQNAKKRRSEGLPVLEYSRMEEFRRLLAPLSKEQMIEILARAASVHDDVYITSKAFVDECPAARRLMVRNISFATENNSLYTVFSQFGPIEDFTIVRERDGKSKGFGFVTFKSRDAVEMALSCPITLDSRNLIVKLATDSNADLSQSAGQAAGTTPSDPKAKRKLFIRNLSDFTTTERLRQTFAVFGPLEDCIVVNDPITGKSKGYGFVTFARQEDAAKAVLQPQRIIDSQMTFVAFASPSSGQKGGDKSAGVGTGANAAALASRGPNALWASQLNNAQLTAAHIPQLAQTQTIDAATYAQLYASQLQQLQYPQLAQQQLQQAAAGQSSRQM